jgi:F-type H+-transporting ATPase subunit b
MQIISNIALISINETLLFQMISFLIFLFIINRIMFRPLRATMREREDYIHRLNQEIVDAKEELETVAAQTKIEENAVRDAAFKVCDELEKIGNKEAHDILMSAREEITELSHKSRQEVDARLDEARKSVDREAEMLALNIMEKLLARKVSQ